MKNDRSYICLTCRFLHTHIYRLHVIKCVRVQQHKKNCAQGN